MANCVGFVWLTEKTFASTPLVHNGLDGTPHWTEKPKIGTNLQSNFDPFYLFDPFNCLCGVSEKRGGEMRQKQQKYKEHIREPKENNTTEC